MPPHEVGDRLIPGSPVRTDARAIPPIRVELAVSEFHNFSQGIQGRLENSKEPSQPNDQGDCGEFHQTLDYRSNVQRSHLVKRVPQNGGGILSRCKPYKHAQTGYFGESFSHKAPPDLGGFWVHWLIYKRRSPPEVGKITQGNVLWIGASRVERW